MPKAYSYIRMSTPEQLKGDSTRRQRKATEEYAKLNGLELADIFHDRGVSAFNGKNAEMGRLGDFLQLAKDGDIERGSYLIVESLDRITRTDLLQAMALLDQIVQCGIVLVTLMDRQTYSKESVADNPTALMMAVMTLIRAHEESLTKSRRLAAAWKNKREIARSGKPTKQRLPGWLKFSTTADEILLVQDRVEALRSIFEMSRDGWGSYSIAKRLNESGVPTWGRAKFWQESYVKKLLSSRAVLGEYQPHRLVQDGFGRGRQPDGEPIAGYYPQVIDPVLFGEANQAISRRRLSGRGRKGASFANLFTGLLRCKLCGSGMRYEDKGPPPKGGRYLRCSKAVLTRECPSTAFRHAIIEQKLLQLLTGVDFDAVLNGPAWREKTRELRLAQQDEVEKEEDLSRKIDTLTDAILAGGHSAALLNLLQSNESALEHVRKRRSDIAGELASFQTMSKSGYLDLIELLKSDEITAEDQAQIRRKAADEIRKFVSHISIGRTNYHPTAFLDPDEYPDHPHLADKDESFFEDPNTNFEIVIAYKNASVQHFDSTLEEEITFAYGERFNLFRERYMIDKLE